jgi:hypothetical protein
MMNSARESNKAGMIGKISAVPHITMRAGIADGGQMAEWNRSSARG